MLLFNHETETCIRGDLSRTRWLKFLTKSASLIHSQQLHQTLRLSSQQQSRFSESVGKMLHFDW